MLNDAMREQISIILLASNISLHLLLEHLNKCKRNAILSGTLYKSYFYLERKFENLNSQLSTDD